MTIILLLGSHLERPVFGTEIVGEIVMFKTLFSVFTVAVFGAMIGLGVMILCFNEIGSILLAYPKADILLTQALNPIAGLALALTISFFAGLFTAKFVTKRWLLPWMFPLKKSE